MSLEFYSNPDLEDGFGATAGRTQPHRGLDFPKPEGVPIPAWAAGTVIISQYHAGLGWVVETDSGTVFPGYCHLVRQGAPVGTTVAVGDIIGFVGNTGSQSFGNHLHTTAGNRRGAVFGASMAYLQDPWPLIVAAQQSGDEMTPEQAQQLSAVYAAIFGPANVDAGEVSWKNPTGTQTAQYGLLPIVIHNQTLIAQLIGQVSALASAAGVGGADLKALEAAAEKGARDALAELTLKATA